MKLEIWSDIACPWCYAIDEQYGISGAQPPAAILDALEQAWRAA